MPFRQKVKRAFGRSNSQSDSLSLQKTISSRNDSSVYQPGEPMPTPKYRGNVDPKHKAKLEKFTFSIRDWKRSSTASQYSPMGSRWSSRNNSLKPPHGTVLAGNSCLGKANESADGPNDVAIVGGAADHSIETVPRSNTDTTKDGVEHQEYADGTKNGIAEAHQPLSEAEVASTLEKLRSRMIMKQAS